jgi:hypothetical protein
LAPHIEAAKMLENSFAIESITPRRTIHVTYPLFHILTYFFHYITAGNYRIAASIVLTSAVISVYFIQLRLFCADSNKKISNEDRLFSLILIIMMCLPLLGKLYLPQCSPTVWHNPTYIVMKPFSLLTYYFYCKILSDKNDDNKLFWKYGIFLILSIIAKPSFALVFLPAVAIITTYSLIKKQLTLKQFLEVVIFSLPGFAILIWQYISTFQEDVSTIVKFGSFMNMSILKAIVATVAVVALPMCYVIWKKKTRESIPQRLKYAFVVFSIGWLQFMFLQEVGYADGNFAWGYMIGIFILYYETYVSFRNDNERATIANGCYVKPLYYIQGICGVLFFAALITLHSYMI